MVVITTSESSSSEEQPAPCRKRTAKPIIKSGKVHIAFSIVSKHATWTNEVVYSAARKHTVYNDISMLLFVHGYLIVMEGERESVKEKMVIHLQELMADAELYGWKGSGQSILCVETNWSRAE